MPFTFGRVFSVWRFLKYWRYRALNVELFENNLIDNWETKLHMHRGENEGHPSELLKTNNEKNYSWNHFLSVKFSQWGSSLLFVVFVFVLNFHERRHEKLYPDNFLCIMRLGIFNIQTELGFLHEDRKIRL